MRGVTKGEQSIALNPILQFFARNGEYLADAIAATYTIQDVHDPAAGPVTKVATTPLNLTDNPPGNRLGLGRYFIPTGDTSDWHYGTHRVLVNYQMTAAGRMYSQAIDFEVLSPTLFSTGQRYTGYAATRDLYRDNYFSIGSQPPQQLHGYINRVSTQIEVMTQRYFEPRYLEMRVSGRGGGTLFLGEALVAVDQVARIEVLNDGERTYYPYTFGSYRVFNRHLDGILNPDDRDNPRLTVSRDDDVLGYYIRYQTRFWVWPSGDNNISVRGVFGYLDPEQQSDFVALGHTPEDFVQIIGTMVSRLAEDPTLTSPATWRPGTIRMYKTRDQQIQFSGPSGSSVMITGFTGDPMLDQLLMRFVKPMNVDYTEHPDAWARI